MTVEIKLPDLSMIKRYAAYHQSVIDLANCVDQIGDLERAIRETDNRLVEKRKEEATLDDKIKEANTKTAEGTAAKIKGINSADEIVAIARKEANEIFAKTKLECDALREKCRQDNAAAVAIARSSIAAFDSNKMAAQAELDAIHAKVYVAKKEHEEVKGKIEVLKANAAHIVKGL